MAKKKRKVVRRKLSTRLSRKRSALLLLSKPKLVTKILSLEQETKRLYDRISPPDEFDKKWDKAPTLDRRSSWVD